MQLSPDFSAFFAVCRRHDVRLVVVGAYALALHGHPRMTKDLDVLVEPSPGNAAALMAALEEFGFGGIGLTADDFAAEGVVVQLGYPPNRIDLLTSIDGVPFADAFARRQVMTVDGTEIPCIAREDLLANKRATGRLQDLADVERLERAAEPDQ